MKTFSFRAVGNPVPQPRQRIRVVRVKGGQVFAQNYTPAKSPVNEWKRIISVEALNAAINSGQRFERPINGPLAIRMAFYFERPRCHLRGFDCLRKSAPLHHVQKPDLDNLAKAVLDALVAASFIYDDSEVVRLEVSKQWADDHPQGVECSIMWELFE